MNIRGLLRQPILTVAFHQADVRWTVGSRGAVRASGRLAMPPDYISDGVILDPEAAGAALKKAPGFPGSFRMQVVLALPAQRTLFRTIEVPPLKGKQFRELVDREIRREMPLAADNAYVAWASAAQQDATAHVFVVAAARDIVDSHVAAAKAAGLQPQSADLRVIAAARAIGQPDCVVASIEHSEVEIAILRGGTPSVVRHVGLNPAHGQDMWTRQLGEELARTLKFYRDTHRSDPLAINLPISFVGDAASEAMKSSEIHDLTDRNAIIPLLPMFGDRDDSGVYAANVGLALKDIAA
jgi:hypothetical protein